jgi:glycosyltransferase involved in cell wall biosynthesis
MAAEHLVSVIMPVLNAERFLRAALDSVLAQTYRRLEIILVDGGSTDGTEAIGRAYPAARWLTQAGSGLAGAWNSGLQAALGQFIAFQDSDDLWVPEKLDRQVAYLAAHPEAEYVLGHVQLFVEPGSPPPPGMLPEVFGGARRGRMPGTLLARRELFDRVGGFDPRFGMTTDIDWFARLDALGVVGGLLTEVVLLKRFHAENVSVSSGASEYARHLPRLLKRALDLRRGRKPETGP